MKTRLSVFILFLLFAMSCNFRKSANVDFLTGLSTMGDGLVCDEVYLSDGENKISGSSFTYGEKVYLNFDNITGFVQHEGSAFPGMLLSVVSQKGDTVLKIDDLYADYTEGINGSPLLLRANLTIADPMHSNSEYTLHVIIWDKQGKGTFKANLGFNVIPNERIVIESKGVSYDEIYLYSPENSATITGDNAGLNENIYMLFEGLRGFKQEAGLVNFGLSLKITDDAGAVVLNEEDLVGDEGMEISKFNSQVAPNFNINDPGIRNPVTCEIVIWDKKSESSIKASVKLNIL
jgi:hypothetical protein